jgi:predicted nuclease with TOPRIM domain
MAYTVNEFRDMLDLLEQHPEWLAQLRALVLTRELLDLPKSLQELAAQVNALTIAVQELTAAQKRTDERLEELAAAQKRTDERVDRLAAAIEELTAAQKRTDERVDRLAAQVNALTVAVQELTAAQKRTDERLEELAAAQKRTDERLEELAAAQKRTDERVDLLSQRMDRLEQQVGRLSNIIGSTLEEEAYGVLSVVMEHKGYRILGEDNYVKLNGDLDVAFPVEDTQGRKLWVLLESKERVGLKDALRWIGRVKDPQWRQKLARKGITGPYLVYMHGIRVDMAAREALKKHGIGLLKAEGEIIPPAGEME